MIVLTQYKLSILEEELDNPHAFIQTDRGQQFLEHLTSDLYYSRYSDDGNRRPMELAQGNKLAEAILSAYHDKEDSREPAVRMHGAAASFFDFGYGTTSYWWQEAHDQVHSALEQIACDLKDTHDVTVGDDWADEWTEYLQDVITQKLGDEDDSEPSDLLGRFDHCEAIFLLKPEGYVIDQMISSNRSWPDFEDLHVGPELQHGLATLGYSLPQYRLLSGNRNPAEDIDTETPKRAERLCSPSQLKEMVENSCAQHFLFALYAVIPVQELLDLDPAQPMVFSKAAVATYNPHSGTFHDCTQAENVTVTPADGELITGNYGYSPDSICGLHIPHYYGNLKNTQTGGSQPLKLAA